LISTIDQTRLLLFSIISPMQCIRLRPGSRESVHQKHLVISDETQSSRISTMSRTPSSETAESPKYAILFFEPDKEQG